MAEIRRQVQEEIFREDRLSRRRYVRYQMEKERGPWDSEMKNAISAALELMDFRKFMVEQEKTWDHELRRSNIFYTADNEKAKIQARVACEKKQANNKTADLEAKLAEGRKAELRRWQEELDLATTLLREEADQAYDRGRSEDNFLDHVLQCIVSDDGTERYTACDDCRDDKNFLAGANAIRAYA
jgi:hypothetical protein